MNKSKLCRFACACLVFVMVVLMIPFGTADVSAASNVVQTQGGRNTYTLFNSGCTGSGRYYSSSSNPAPDTLTNNGYDIYLRTSGGVRRSRLGLSFYISDTVTERATLTINAFDVDESSGERDLVYLYDETTGSQVQITEGHGYLSGMNQQWNTTTFYINPSLFTKGHTYHIELYDSVTGWVVWIRNVSLNLTTSGVQKPIDPSMPTVTQSDFSASIDTSRNITTNLYLKSTGDVTYFVEYAATVNSNQYASYFGSVNVTPSGVSYPINFTLEYGAPKGVYKVEAITKDTYGNVINTYFVSAGYYYSAVNYNPNGGSYNVPVDSNAYSSGTSVSVLYDYIPTREGYKFIGWSTTKGATTAQYTQGNGARVTVDGVNDVVLYAVWEQVEAHKYVEHKAKAPTCSEPGWDAYTTCTHCTYSTFKLIPATGHKYTNSCDSTCNECGTERIAPHTGSNWSRNEQGHSGQCSDCKIVITNAAHIYDNNCDDECNTCRYTRQAPHTCESNWKSNEVHHYKVCAECNGAVSMTAHSYDGVCDTDCNECGYERTAPHGTLGNFEKDNTGHWRNCTLCNEKTSFAEHRYTNTSDLTCNDCGWERKVCTPASTWSSDGEYHWKYCTDCGDKLEMTKHQLKVTANCTRDAVCRICNAVVTPKLGHDWVIEEVLVEATCNTEGSAKYSCNRCGADYTDTIPAGQHKESDWIIDKQATLFSEGSKHIECEICHTVLGTATIPKIGRGIDDEVGKQPEETTPSESETEYPPNETEPAESQTEDTEEEETKKKKPSKSDDDDDDRSSSKKKKTGCNSSVSVGGISVAGVAVAAAVMSLRKRGKKED